MSRSSRTNPLALAVLVTLFDGPLHPYDVARTLRFRQHDRSMRLNFGSLYAVVNGLARRQLIEVVDTRRAGNRPERTVYALTAAGRAEALDWLAELVGTPAKEYPQFEAALTLVGALDPDEALELLTGRLVALDQALALDTTALESGRRELSLPRVFLLEAEYELAMRRAEADFVRSVVAELRDGTFSGLDSWRRVAAGEPLPELGTPVVPSTHEEP